MREKKMVSIYKHMHIARRKYVKVILISVISVTVVDGIYGFLLYPFHLSLTLSQNLDCSEPFT